MIIPMSCERESPTMTPNKPKEKKRSKQNPIPKITKPKENLKNPFGKKKTKKKREARLSLQLISCKLQSLQRNANANTRNTHQLKSFALFLFFTIFILFSSLATVLVPFPNSNGKMTEDS
jgi:hypothetical protein